MQADSPVAGAAQESRNGRDRLKVVGSKPRANGLSASDLEWDDRAQSNSALLANDESMVSRC
jgi:hypothetical protein